MLAPLLGSRRPSVRASARDETHAVAARRALVLAPHPDDETLACGATILRKLAAGTEVTVVVVSDGRHSHQSPYVSPDDLAAMRSAEVREAARRLGLAPESLRQLDYEDGRLSENEDELAAVIGRIVAELRPAEVYVTGAFEPLPDHAALGRAARRALKAMADPPLLLEYPIWLWHSVLTGARTPLATRAGVLFRAGAVLLGGRRAIVVRSEEFLAAKMRALAAHSSQLERPAVVPASEPWPGLPQPLLANAADSVELFLPWRP